MKVLGAAILVVLGVASLTNGPIQELCATAGYLGIGAAALLLIGERFAKPRE